MLDLTGSSPVLVFGGPYSNLRALVAMRARAEELGISAGRSICTGDVAAYCVEPEETVAEMRAWGCHVVAGNCEEQLAASAEDCGCGFDADTECDRLAKSWYEFANARVSVSSRAWMGSLPRTLTFLHGGLRFHVVHGGVDLINRFVFASERAAIAEELAKAHAAVAADVVIAGHAGIPFISRFGTRVWFNAGVIGMPANDGTPDVWYGLISTEGDEVTLSTHRLAYDYNAAAGSMRRWGHANGYARSLVTGLWPSLDVLPESERALTGKRIKHRVVRLPRRREAAAAEGGTKLRQSA